MKPGALLIGKDHLTSFGGSHRLLAFLLLIPLLSGACATIKLSEATRMGQIAVANTGYISRDQFIMPYALGQVRSNVFVKIEQRWLSMPLHDFQTAAGYRTNMKGIKLHKEPLPNSLTQEGKPVMVAIQVDNKWSIYLCETSRKIHIPELTDKNYFFMLGYPFTLAFDIATLPVQWVWGMHRFIKQGAI